MFGPLGEDMINSQVAETHADMLTSCVTITIWLFLRATEQRGGSRRWSDGEAIQVERTEEDRRRRGKERDDHPHPPRSADKAR